MEKRGWDKSPSLSIIFGLSSKTQWLSGLYYADFISFYSPTQLCGGGTTKSNSNELPISVPLSFLMHVGGAMKGQTGAIGLQGDLDGKPLVSLCHLIGLFG